MHARLLVLMLGLLLCMQAKANLPTADDAQAEKTAGCFSAEDNRKLSFDVYRSGWAPVAKNQDGLLARSPLYPATAFATMQLDRITGPQTSDPAQNMTYANYFFLWGNRCLAFSNDEQECRNTKRVKGNDYNNRVSVVVDGKRVEARPMFSSYQRADSCTTLQALNAAGVAEAELKTAAEKEGLKTFFRYAGDGKALADVADITQTMANGRIEKRPYFVDTCLFDKRMGAGPAGVIIDYEVWDERSPAQTRTFLLQMARALHERGKSFMVFTNSLVSQGARKGNGIDASNLKDVITASDGFFPVVWSGATPGGIEIDAHDRKESFVQNFDAQMRYLRDAGVNSPELMRKIHPVISIYDLRAGEAQQLHQAIKAQGLGGVMLWRNGVAADSACSMITGPILRNLLYGG